MSNRALGAITFLGLLFGGLIFGSSDHAGVQCLGVTLGWSGFFALVVLAFRAEGV